jgi:tRNA-uridine 2-sulfurtransferase
MTPPLAVVAMSGGVDSSVAALLLLEAGYRVEGASLRLWDSSRRDDRICSDHRDGARVADALGIPHTLIDERTAFDRTVVGPFVAAYASGRTPNPCVACNGGFKLGVLLDWALARGAAVVATGHYARIERRGSRRILRRAADGARDQSYFLFALGQRQLAHAAFPLGEWTKAEVRRRAAERGLPVAEKLDSQDLCFGDPAALVRARGLGGVKGDVVNDRGDPLGRHDGIEAFTVGQRRGLGLSAAGPLYVQSIDAERGRVVVGLTPSRCTGLVASGWSWVDSPATEDEPLLAQIRYRHSPLPVRVRAEGEGRARVTFDRPVPAVAPGQAVVVYRGDEVVGGGWIDRPTGRDGAS